MTNSIFRKADPRGRRLQRHRNGIAQAFRTKGARVQVCGTRASAADYSKTDGSDLEGLDYARNSMSATQKPSRRSRRRSDRFDVLVLAQGAVIYPARRVRDGRISQGARGQPDQPDGLCREIPSDVESSQGLIDHRLIDRGLSRDKRQSRLQRLEDRPRWVLTRTLAQAWAEDGIRVNGKSRRGWSIPSMTKVTTANPKRLEGALERIPLKRLAHRPTWPAPRCTLASPLASYVAGHTLVVDGGLIL